MSVTSFKLELVKKPAEQRQGMFWVRDQQLGRAMEGRAECKVGSETTGPSSQQNLNDGMEVAGSGQERRKNPKWSKARLAARANG